MNVYMKTLLEYIVKSIVEKPEAVKVAEVVENSGLTVLNLEVAPQDIGLVIGKEGKIIKAIRNLVRTKALGQKKRVTIRLIEKT